MRVLRSRPQRVVSNVYWSVRQETMYEMVLELIEYNRVGNRPGRREPRAVKRRPKPYPLLRKPRQTIKKALGA